MTVQPHYTFKAELVRVIDGDTIVARLNLGFYMTAELSLRLARINAPEMNSKDPLEREAARRATLTLRSLLDRTPLYIVTRKSDKYGRFLAECYIPGTDLEEQINVNDYLLETGMAKPYGQMEMPL